MVNTHNGKGDLKPANPNGNPPTLSRDEQNELLRHMVANSAHGGHGVRNAPAPAPTTYSDFATTHLPLFTEAGEPLEADHWFRVIESKFGLLHCTKVQKTLFTAQ
jgi:hypothetical protein